MEYLIEQSHLDAAIGAGACESHLRRYRAGMQIADIRQSDVEWVEHNLPIIAEAVRLEIGIPFWAVVKEGSGHTPFIGDGYGYRDAYSHGDSDGYGHGCGDGCGYGYDYGDGDGCGYGDGCYGGVGGGDNRSGSDGSGSGDNDGYGNSYEDGSGAAAAWEKAPWNS